MSFYSIEGLRAVAEYLDELLESGVLSQRQLARDSGVAASTIGNLRLNKANTTKIEKWIDPDIILAIAPHIPDPRLPQIAGQPPRTFANPEDFLSMARGIIPLKKEPGQAKTGLSRWLLEQMASRGLNPAQFSELVELPEQRIQQLFNGWPPSSGECLRIARTVANGDAELIFSLAGQDLNAPLVQNGNGKH